MSFLIIFNLEKFLCVKVVEIGILKAILGLRKEHEFYMLCSIIVAELPRLNYLYLIKYYKIF